MKQAKRDRTILLSDEAVQLLKDLPRYTGQTKVFLSNQMQTLSDMTMSMVLRRLHKKQKNIDGIGWIDKRKKAREPKKIASLLLTVVHVQHSELGQKTTLLGTIKSLIKKL